MSDTLNCSFCCFFEGNRQQPSLGNCHRFPPVSLGLLPTPGLDGKIRVDPIFSFAKVRSKQDWCGEFQSVPDLAPGSTASN